MTILSDSQRCESSQPGSENVGPVPNSPVLLPRLGECSFGWVQTGDART